MAFKGTTKEIDEWCRWNFNSFFLESIRNGLDYLRDECRHGPARFTPKEWDTILTVMMDGFDVIKKKMAKNSECSFKDFTREEKTKIGRSFDLFQEYFFDLRDYE